jgi:hypothetical protein
MPVFNGSTTTAVVVAVTRARRKTWLRQGSGTAYFLATAWRPFVEFLPM